MTIPEIVTSINAAAVTFDFARVRELSEALVVQILASQDLKIAEATPVLSVLRRKTCFDELVRVTDALIASGSATPTVHRQYGQALIEVGALAAAEYVLRDALINHKSESEEPELLGLLGRVFKQRYVMSPNGAAVLRRQTLQQAIDWYAGPYKKDRVKHYWHGINVVALLERGRRDGVDVSVGKPPLDIAKQVIASIAGDATPREQLYAYVIATEMEANVALGEHARAAELVREYVVAQGADAFELRSTLRQLVEVWNLKDTSPPGGILLPVLRAALLRQRGGSLSLQASSIPAERERIQQLERVHGFQASQTLQWYRDGLDRCTAIARIESGNGRAAGTGWLVEARHLFDTTSEEPLLVTNAHVVSPLTPPYAKALRPVDAFANFQVAGHRTAIKQVVWSSNVELLDCTVLRLAANPDPTKVTPLPVGDDVLWDAVPKPLMYIVGHPGGRDLELSLQDNQLIDCDLAAGRMRYRTPTEGGSSGSPVFDSAWKVVGLHHAGDDAARSGDANEGIPLEVLRANSRRHPFTPAP